MTGRSWRFFRGRGILIFFPGRFLGQRSNKISLWNNSPGWVIGNAWCRISPSPNQWYMALSEQVTFPAMFCTSTDFTSLIGICTSGAILFTSLSLSRKVQAVSRRLSAATTGLGPRLFFVLGTCADFSPLPAGLPIFLGAGSVFGAGSVLGAGSDFSPPPDGFLLLLGAGPVFGIGSVFGAGFVLGAGSVLASVLSYFCLFCRTELTILTGAGGCLSADFTIVLTEMEY